MNPPSTFARPSTTSLGSSNPSQISNNKKRLKLFSHKFQTPIKIIKTELDVKKYTRSTSYKTFKFFIEQLAQSVINVNYQNSPFSKNLPENNHPEFDEVSNFTMKTLSDLLTRLSILVDETPCHNDPCTHRFGNRAFQDLFDKFIEENVSFIRSIVENTVVQEMEIEKDLENISHSEKEEKIESIVEELKVYLNDSIGNKQRIDYGSGHEAAFLAFIFCLFSINAISSTAKCYKIYFVNKIFKQYLTVMRKIQTTYRLEPAGSKGNFGLDDFQFCVFIFGAAQLRDNDEKLIPDDFTRADCCKRFSDKYMFFEAVDYINTVKDGPFCEHSNKLWNISGVPFWHKVHEGLIKMYAAEVLAKFPIMQHFYFGSIFVKPF